jgi:glycosyltransferase involved in cell wall biosynthesis
VTRSLAFSVNLKAFGWEPTVLTVADSKDTWMRKHERVPEGISIVRTGELNLHGFVELAHGATNRLWRLAGRELEKNYFRDLLCVPDAQIAWFSSLRGTRLAYDHDVIYISCSPFSSAISGVIMKLFSGRPLVLDFRDPWSLNPHNHHVAFHRLIASREERWAIERCDKLILNTPSAERLYRRAYPGCAAKMVTIPNGYDRLNPALPQAAGSPFRIMHVGHFYRTRQPDLLLEALARIGNPEIEFVQIGGAAEALTRYREKVSITVVDSMPHSEALDAMRTASLLYMKQGFEADVAEYAPIAAKTYEYLATGLPILAESPPGDNVDLVRQYAAHAHIVTRPDVVALQEAVLHAYSERHTAMPSISDSFVAQFSRVSLTQQLARILADVT